MMNVKCLILSAILLSTVAAGFSQDSSKLSAGKYLKKNLDTLNSIHHDKGIVNRTTSSGAHTSVNSNRGIVTPNTTSGTLNSTVNPNTQLVIPIRKNKRKLNPNVIHDPGIVTPEKK
ncbi:MAG: hypothetical protein ABI834_05445 [Ginsengibacter sp.]